MSLPFWWIKEPTGVEVKTVPRESQLKVVKLSIPDNPLIELNAPNVQWQLISGVIYHVSSSGGGGTYLFIKKDVDPIFMARVIHTDTTGYYAIDLRGGSAIILRDKYSISLANAVAVGAIATLHILQTAI